MVDIPDVSFLTNGLSEMSRVNLRTIADHHFRNLSTPMLIQRPKESQPVYLEQRSEYKRAVTLGVLSGHKDTEAAFENLREQQSGYLASNLRDLEPMSTNIAEEKAMWIQEIESLMPKLERYKKLELELDQSLRKKEQPRRGIYGKLGELEKEIMKIDEFQENVRQLEVTESNLNRIFNDLKTLHKAGDASIHYELEPLENYVEQLKKGEYEGPKFDPIKVVETHVVEDIIKREQVTMQSPQYSVKANGLTDLREIGMPKILEDCLTLKQWCDSRPGDEKYTSRDIKDSVDIDIGPKGIGAILERAFEYFGMACAKNVYRKYRKMRGFAPVNDVEFLHAMIDKDILGVPELTKVNRFYCEKLAEAALRNGKVYEGADLDYMIHLSHSKGLPLGKRTIAKNFGENNAHKFGLEYKRGVLLATEVRPTDEERDHALGALPELGYGVVGPEDLQQEIRKKQGYEIHVKVAEKLFEEHALEYDYAEVKGRPGMYQRTDRPDTIEQKRKNTPEEPGGLI